MMNKVLALLLSVLFVAFSAVTVFASAPYDAASDESETETQAAVIEKIEDIEDKEYLFSSNSYNSVTPEIISTHDGHRLEWDSFEGASSYRVYTKTEEGWNNMAETSDTYYLTAPLESGKEYTYAVAPVNEKGRLIGAFDPNGLSSYFFSTPVLSYVSLFGNSLKVSWNRVGNAQMYRVFVKHGNEWDVLCDTEDDYYCDFDTVPGRIYTYTVAVVSKNNDNEDYLSSAFDETGKSAKFFTMPEVTGFENTRDGVEVSWSRSDGASAYKLFYKNGDSWKTLCTTKDRKYLHKIKENREFVYTVRAVDDKGKFISDYDHKGWSNIYILPPSLSGIQNTENGVKTSWKAQNGDELYRVYVKDGSSWKKIAETTDTSYTDRNVQSGKKYTYTVRCMSADGKEFRSSFSSSGISITYVGTPFITKIENKNDGANIQWNKQSGASKYRVFTKSGASWKTLGDTTGTSYVHKNLSNGSEFTYTVRALDSKGKFVSGYDKNGVKNVYLKAPVIKSVAASGNGIKFSWNSVNKAEKYRVYVKSGSSSWKQIGNTRDTYFQDNNVKSGTTYYYTVRCISDDEKTFMSDYDHTGKSIKYIETPKITKFENQASSVRISWNSVTGGYKYRVFYKNGTSWKTLGDTTSTSFTHTGVTNLKEYIYTVRVLDKNSNFISGYNSDGWKNTFIAPPTITSVALVGRTTVVSWKEVKPAAGFRVYRKSFLSGWKIIADTDKNNYMDDDYPTKVPYTYTVRCIDRDGNLISSYIDNTKYYYNGEIANGKITVDGVSYAFVDGTVRSGYIKTNGNTYYYNTEGVLEKNGIVGDSKNGYRYADKDGKVDFSYCGAVTFKGSDYNVVNGAVTKVSSEYDKTLNRALKTVARITNSSMTKAQKLRKAFEHVRDGYKEYNPRIPHYTGNDWHLIYANDIFVGGGGNCISYGAAFAFMAKAIGYTNVVACNSGGHGWAEIGGKAYDPEWAKHHTKYTYFGVGYHDTDVNYGLVHESGKPAWMVKKI